MPVAEHLGIQVAQYDRLIRRFIPRYEEMLTAAAAAAGSGPLLDLGIGTGALAQRCLELQPRRRLAGVDADAAMLALARTRLGPKSALICGDFEELDWPPCQAIVSSLALHHIATVAAKQKLYRRCYLALRRARAGRLISADCFPASAAGIARGQFGAWRAHMESSFSRRETASWFRRWQREDHYLPLNTELDLLRAAGFHPEVLWRHGCFAVIAAATRA